MKNGANSTGRRQQAENHYRTHRVDAAQNCQNMGTPPNSFCLCHTQGLCWPNVRQIAYTFRVPGPEFKAGLILFIGFFFCAFSPFQHTSGVDDAQIRQYFCCAASFFGSYAQLCDTTGPILFQITKTKLLPFAACSSHRFQQGRCCLNPTQYCLYPGLKGQVLHKLEL